MILRLVAVLGLAVILSACDTLSEDECRAGNWQEIGFRDGVDGRTADHLARHGRACADLGITPDQAAWLAGREAGLRQYCTPRNAYRIGRSGRRINPVCTEQERAAMTEPHLIGLRYHEIREDIRDLEDDARRIRSMIRDLSGSGDPVEVAERAALRRELRRLERRISRLEVRSLRYDNWPI